MFSFVIQSQPPSDSLKYKRSSNNKVPCAFLTVSWDAWCWVTSAVYLHQLPSSGVESVSHSHFYFFADNFQLAQFDSSSWIYLNPKAKRVYIDILAIIVSIFQVLQKLYLNRIFLDIKQASNTIAEKWAFIFQLILLWTTQWWGHAEGIPRHTEKHPCI